jgi:hypothetical protein
MVRRVAESLAPNDGTEQSRLIKETVEKAVPVLEKMEEDSNGRLQVTLHQLRGGRMGCYRFVQGNTIEALMVEVVHVQKLPWAVPLFSSLKAELKAFKQIADQCDITMDCWEFWRTYYLSLPGKK